LYVLHCNIVTQYIGNKMSQVIRIPDIIYNRLGRLVEGFETPADVIERILYYYEEKNPDKINKSFRAKTKERKISESKRGRKGYEQVEHYLIPIIHLLKGERKEYQEAFHIVAKKLGVDYTTVLAQCTRTLNMRLDDFLAKVEDGRIMNIIMNKYLNKKEFIKRELGKYYR